MQRERLRPLCREDLPQVRVSRLRAANMIGPSTSEVAISLGAHSFVVRLYLQRFPNGGSWSLFLCPECSRTCRILWFFSAARSSDHLDHVICRRCCLARHIGVKTWWTGRGNRGRATRRAELTIPILRRKLAYPTPKGCYRMKRRRKHLAHLARCELLVARKISRGHGGPTHDDGPAS
jgi:hypothetical protein